MLSQNNKTGSKQYLWYGSFICAIAAFFYCYEFILRIIPGVLQTELTALFGHISASAFGQLSALYYFAYSPMQMPVGMLMDRFGPRRLFQLNFNCGIRALFNWFWFIFCFCWSTLLRCAMVATQIFFVTCRPHDNIRYAGLSIWRN